MPTDIRHLDLTLPTPAANLACDEALLEDREGRGGPGVLRFWESSIHFIVVGYAARLAEEVDLDACHTLAIPILRRCSGGGTVVQGPGCLNYSLILPLNAVGEAATITQTNRFVMERHRAALEALLDQPVVVAGHTDLALGDRKFSGNAQRRKRDWFLFHGTFLLGFDLPLIEHVLRSPPRQPDYRRQRGHLDFVTQIQATPRQVRDAVRAAWNATEPFAGSAENSGLESAIDQLVGTRYGNDEWNLRPDRS